MELNTLTITDALKGLIAGEFSPTDLLEACLQQAENKKDLNAYVTMCSESVREEAKTAERILHSAKNTGEALPKLLGIPVAVKDLFCTKGIRTTACSKILEDFVPTYESTATTKLRASGAVVPGKTNMDEFAMGSTNENSCFGPVKNPYRAKNAPDKGLVPGGSSGGSAVAVAAHTSLGALGSDTGGSVRQPAALCGIVGMKPTYGRVSRYGMIAFASSLDQAGVFAKTVEDAALLLEVIAGYDTRDSTSTNIPVPEYSKLIDKNIKGMRIGIPKEYYVDGMSPELVELWHTGRDWLKSVGAEIVEVSLPHSKYSLATYYVLAFSQAASNLSRYDGVRYGLRVPAEAMTEMLEETRGQGFGREVKRRVLMGTYELLQNHEFDYYTQALKVQAMIARDFRQVFGEQRVDAILTPTTTSGAFPIGQKISDPIAMYLNDIFTVPVNIAGLPGISVPSGYDHDGLPLGLQLIADRFQEAKLFSIASVLEECAKG